MRALCANQPMSIKEINKGDDLYKQAQKLRYELFFREHGLPWEILNDENERHSTHVVVSHEQNLIAYGRLSKLENREFQISQMVVSPSYQGQGNGTQLLLKLVAMAKSKGAKVISLNSRTTAISLYQNQGFQSVGKVFKSSSTGVPHIKMVHHAST